MAWRRGDTILVDFPFVDRFGSKHRPALIVSGGNYHSERPQDVIVAVISTQVHKYSGSTDYLLNDWQTAVLSQPSVVHSTLLTILSARISRRIGHLSDADLGQVELRLKTSLEL